MDIRESLLNEDEMKDRQERLAREEKLREMERESKKESKEKEENIKKKKKKNQSDGIVGEEEEETKLNGEGEQEPEEEKEKEKKKVEESDDEIESDHSDTMVTFTNTFELKSNSCALEEGELDDYNEEDDKKNREAEHVVQGVVEGVICFGSGIANGITGVVVEPIEGAREKGAKGFFKGAAVGLAGVVIHPIKGSAGFLTKAAEGLRNTPDTIFTENNEIIPNNPPLKEKEADNLLEGLYQGSFSLGKNIFEGVTGLVTQPIKGAQEQGAKGFFKGLGSGLMGVVVKPVSGAMDFVGKPIEGIANTPKSIKNAIENRVNKD